MLKNATIPFAGHALGGKRPWAMAMVWQRLAFLHWAVPVDALSAFVLKPIRPHLDTYAGQAYLGVVPFAMSGIRGRGLPPVPGASAFPELNLRTYVTIDGQPGVWFFSLDAAHKLAVRVARATFGLPYFDAAMFLRVASDHAVHFQGDRTHRDAVPATFAGHYQPTGPVFRAEPGSLEHFLTERYCLYAMRRGQLMRGDIWHAPWPLQEADCHLQACDMGRLAGVDLDTAGPPVSVLYADRLEVRAWLPVRVF